MLRRPSYSCFVAAAVLAVCGSSADVQAAARVVQTAGNRSAAIVTNASDTHPSKMIEIALDDDRTLRGRFVDSAGEPIDGAVVTLRQSERVIARSTTIANGDFAIHSVPAGVYRLSCGSAARPIRCWTSDAAPPNAVGDGLTFQDSVVRGQAGVLIPALAGSSIATTTAATGAVIGGVAVYASTEPGSGSGRTVTTSTGRAELAPGGTPVPSINSNGQPVGRDIHGNLIRLPGEAPWESGDRTGPPKDSMAIMLPDNWPGAGDDSWTPASP